MFLSAYIFFFLLTVYILNNQKFFAIMPSFFANRLRQSSDSPVLRIVPQIAYVLDVPVILPVFSSTSAMLSWMEAWSLAAMIRLLAEHFLGMYKSTYSPASFCMMMSRKMSRD